MDDSQVSIFHQRPRLRFNKLWIIFPVVFCTALAQGNLVLGLIFYSRDVFQASSSVTATLAGIWWITYMGACLLLPPLRQRLLPRYCTLVASAGQCTLILLILFFSSLPATFVLFALHGVATSFFWPAAMGWLSANCEDAQLGRRMGCFNFSWSFAAVFSPLVAGRLSDAGSSYPLFMAAALTGGCILLGLAGVLLLPKSKQDDAAHHREKETKGGEDAGSPLRYAAWVGVFCAYFISGLLYNILPMILRQDFALDKTQVGALFFCRALANSVGLAVMGRWIWWHHREKQLIGGIVVMAVLMGAFAFTRNASLLTVWLILAGLCLAHSYANSMFHGIVGSIRRGRRMAIHEALLAAGLFVGSISGGVVYERHGMRPMYLMGLVLLLFCAALQLYMLKRNHARDGR